jgi:hypothetical protein
MSALRSPLRCGKWVYYLHLQVLASKILNTESYSCDISVIKMAGSKLFLKKQNATSRRYTNL